MSKKLDLGSKGKEPEPQYPLLITSEIGTMLSLAPNINLMADYSGVTCYSLSNGDRATAQSFSRQDRHHVAGVIELLDREHKFDIPRNAHIGRCLELSFVAEAAGNAPELWKPEAAMLVEEFLEDAFGYRLDYDLRDACNAVKSVSEWTADCDLGPTKASILIHIEGQPVALLSLAMQGISLQYSIDGHAYRSYLEFSSYTDLATSSIGEYDWYAACWNHLYFQVLEACGIQSDKSGFFYTEGVRSNDEYTLGCTAEHMITATRPATIAKAVYAYLEPLKDTRLVY